MEKTNGFNPETRRLMRESTWSKESFAMKRFFPDFVEDEDQTFHIEGTGQSHSLGSSRRGKRLALRQNELHGMFRGTPLPAAPIPSDERLRPVIQHFRNALHDGGEKGLRHDKLLGKKTEQDRIDERDRLIALRDGVESPVLASAMDGVIAMFDVPAGDLHGRFLKYVVEPLGNLEIARRLHLEYGEGVRLDHDRENRESGVYVQTSFTYDSKGRAVYPRLKAVRALTANLLVNTAWPIIAGLNDFDVNWEYLRCNAELLDHMYHVYLIDPLPTVLKEIHEFQDSLTGTPFKETREAAGMGMAYGVLRFHFDLNLKIPSPLSYSSSWRLPHAI